METISAAVFDVHPDAAPLHGKITLTRIADDAIWEEPERKAK